jgi:hypothetical protein
MFRAYFTISRDASQEPIFKGHSLLFIAASYLSPKYTLLNLESGSKFNYTTSTATKFSTSRVVCVHTQLYLPCTNARLGIYNCVCTHTTILYSWLSMNNPWNTRNPLLILLVPKGV